MSRPKNAKCSVCGLLTAGRVVEVLEGTFCPDGKMCPTPTKCAVNDLCTLRGEKPRVVFESTKREVRPSRHRVGGASGRGALAGAWCPGGGLPSLVNEAHLYGNSDAMPTAAVMLNARASDLARRAARALGIAPADYASMIVSRDAIRDLSADVIVTSPGQLLARPQGPR